MQNQVSFFIVSSSNRISFCIQNAKKRHLSPSNEGLEPRFPDGWGGVLVYLTHTLNVGICPLKKEILNELIVNYEILLFLYLLEKRLIVGKMEYPQLKFCEKFKLQ